MDARALGLAGSAPSGGLPESVVVRSSPVETKAVQSGAGGGPAAAQRGETSGAAPMVRTYSEVRLDPKTHELRLTVRDAGSGEVLIAWPLGSVQRAAAAGTYVAGGLLERSA